MKAVVFILILLFLLSAVNPSTDLGYSVLMGVTGVIMYFFVGYSMMSKKRKR